MNGKWRWQKFTIGILYLGCSTYLCSRGIAHGTDATALGIMCAGLATGVGAVIWGNVAEHRAQAAAVQP